MSNANSTSSSSVAPMRGDSKGEMESKEQPIQSASASSSSAAPSVPVAAAADAAAHQLARRSQQREEARRNPVALSRKRTKPLIQVGYRAIRRQEELAAQWRSFGPAQRLFTDGIALCLGFLSLEEFNRAAQSCTGWREGSKRVKSLGGEVELKDVAERGRLSRIASSPYRHLVTSLTDWYAGNDPDPEQWWEPDWPTSHPSNWSWTAFRKMSTLVGVTSLQSLHLDIGQLEGAATVPFPPNLKSAELDLGCWQIMNARHWRERAIDTSALLRGLVACSSLTRLSLQLIEEIVPVNLATLASLKQLHELTLRGYPTIHFTPAVMCAIKTLPLRRLALLHTDERYADDLDPEAWLPPLLALPHAFQRNLQTLDLTWMDLALPTMDRLLSLPSLTTLRPHFLCVLVLPALESFSKLRTLHLAFDGGWDMITHDDIDDYADSFSEEGSVLATAFLPHLVHCSLTELSVQRAAFQEGDLAALCKAQPSLQNLTLAEVAVSELRGLETLAQLRHFTLSAAFHSDVLIDAFQRLSLCKGLQELGLATVHEMLSELQRQQLTPPSALLPELTSFAFEVRKMDDHAAFNE